MKGRQGYNGTCRYFNKVWLNTGNFCDKPCGGHVFYLRRAKIAAFLQDRVGPNRAGPFGIFQPLADGAKMFMKEEIIPTQASGLLFIVGPSLAIMTACIGSAVIPWGQSLQIGSYTIPLQVTDINVGILYIFGVVSLGVYGIMIGGWASNNKYSLLGAIRAASQNISYEISMGLSIIALLMVTNTLSLKENSTTAARILG